MCDRDNCLARLRNRSWPVGGGMGKRGSTSISRSENTTNKSVVPQSPLKEALGGCRVTPFSQQEVDGLPGGIDSSVQESLSSLDVDVRFIQPPTSICPSQVRTTALVHLRT